MNLPEMIRGARTVLILRTDAIGDNVLGGAMLKPLRAALPTARIIYACQDRAAELFGACPFVDEVISFSRGRAYADEGYRADIAKKLAGVKADVLLNPVLTREPLADSLAAECGAAVRVAFGGGAKGCRDEAYTHLLPPASGWRLELERVPEFLRGLEIECTLAETKIWLTVDDDAVAKQLLAKNRLDAAHTVVLYGGALAEYRVNRSLGKGLSLAFPEREMQVICVGAAHEFSLHEELLGDYPGKHLNLCGRTTLLQTAALIKHARLALGAETGAVHLAAALGTPNVVVVGGGHFGRFVPWSATTTCVCLPLECFRCDWTCRHARAHCVADISAESIAAGIREAMGGHSDKPRILVQGDGAGGVAAADVSQFLDSKSIDIIPVERSAHGTGHNASPLVELGVRTKGPAPLAPDEFRVTAIVSTYKSEKFIRGCLQDLVEQTLFERGQLEILVIDADSPENEAAVVRGFQEQHGTGRIRYHRTMRRETLYASWNRAIDLARGTYLTNANTDDRHHPEMLERLAATLDARPECGLAYCDSDITHDANAGWKEAQRVRQPILPEYSREALFAESFVGPHPMWRKQMHQEIGYFDPTMVSAGDYEFWLRMSLRRPLVHVRESLGLYLENPQGISLGNIGLTWYEVRLARERYWKKEWGADPAMRTVAAAFGDLARRSRRLPAGVRVALFGAGQHTGRHLARFRTALEPHLKVVAVLDDRPGAERVIGGMPVVGSDQWRSLAIDAVILSSDTYETVLAGRAMELTAGTLPILAVYKHSLDHHPAPELVRAANHAGGTF